MASVHRLISTCLGIGLTPKGGGTLTAAVCCIVWWVAFREGNGHSWWISLKGRSGNYWEEALVIGALLAIGVYSAGRMERSWGKDDQRIVIDEAAGMCLSLFSVPVRWPYILTGFVLFRWFDIRKPLYIGRMERLNGGWGVMMDDVLAGVYANLLLQLVVWIKPW